MMLFIWLKMSDYLHSVAAADGCHFLDQDSICVRSKPKKAFETSLAYHPEWK
jgi:hypothetical protein